MREVFQYGQEGQFVKSWESAASAAKYFRIDESSIRKAAKKKKTSVGYYWGRQKLTNLFNPQVEDFNFPKILLFDIETAPLLAFIWRLKTRYISPDLLERSNWWLISWSAKWLFVDHILHDVVTSEEAEQEDDSRILQSIWSLIDEADIIISHNGINFDHKILNMRWLINDVPPPASYRVIDTYRSCKNLFDFPSYKLGFIAQQLGISEKLEHEGFDMWRKSVKGDSKALQEMLTYNDQDVRTLEELYLTIRPWIKNHPNLGIFMESEEPVCRVCGSSKLVPLPYQDYTTNLSKYETLRCECNAINKRRVSKLPLSVRKVLMSGMPA